MVKPIITIKEEHQIENIINKSHFIAHIRPVQNEEDAKAFINEIKSLYKILSLSNEFDIKCTVCCIF